MSMGSKRTAVWLIAGLFALTAQAADRIEPDAVNRIVDEGFNRSELPQIASYLTDRIGARLTNSPQMREAEQWTQEQFRAWGLTNVHLEGFEFGRGWSIEKSSVRTAGKRPARERGPTKSWNSLTADHGNPDRNSSTGAKSHLPGKPKVPRSSRRCRTSVEIRLCSLPRMIRFRKLPKKSS